MSAAASRKYFRTNNMFRRLGVPAFAGLSGVACGMWRDDERTAQCSLLNAASGSTAACQGGDVEGEILARLASIEAKLDGAVAASPNKPPSALMPWTRSTLERVLFTEDEIAASVERLAAEIDAAYGDAREDEFVVVGLLSGCFIFMADLSRKITVPHHVDFMAVSSYGRETTSSSNVKIKKDTTMPLENKHVLLVDEMCDSGGTLASLKALVEKRGAKSVRTCCLLDKAERRTANVKLDFVGMTCPDEFVVGYGMDWANRFRSLPHVSVVRRSAYE